MTTHTLFVEVRCEDLPARFVEPAVEQLTARLQQSLQGLYEGGVRSWATPRRLAVAIDGVIEATPVEETLVTGPPEQAAFRDGQPTKAAEGFARSKGLSVDELEVVDGPKGRVIGARVKVGGDSTADKLAAELEEIVLGVRLPKQMRWGEGDVRWARPIHGVVALLGSQLIETRVAGVGTTHWTIGHRQTPEPFDVTGPDSWLEQCRAHHVEPDIDTRRASIRRQCSELSDAGGFDVVLQAGLLDEVTHLVEWPTVIAATFPDSLLDLPPRLLEETMRVHTRTFPTYKDGQITNRFLIAQNNPFGDPAIIADGNARVIIARFHDAQFFFAEDKKKKLEDYAEGLAGMQWIRKGGSMADKSQRIATLSAELAPRLGADADKAGRAGKLSKCDLVTQMVGEFPELQGHVGRLLAERDEDATVALAIEEHYLPRFSDDALPSTAEGRAVALADRLDTLAGCFHHGLAPKGSADPLGLRRAANGVVAIVLDAGLRGSLATLVTNTSFGFEEGLADFVLARLRAQLLERWPTEVVEAVMATGDDDAVALSARADAMGALAQSAEFAPLKTTFKRVMGLTKDHTDTNYDSARFADQVEHDLADAWEGVRDEARGHIEALAYDQALGSLSTLKPRVDAFFDGVLVMADDEALRNNRLGLLRAIADEFRAIADFTKLSVD